MLSAVADISEHALRLVGAFYVFAGYLTARAALTSHFIDRALAAVSATKPTRPECFRSMWLIGAALVILAGGALLMLLVDMAAWVFLASAMGQAVYLFWLAPRFFDAEDPPDPAGRRQTANAFFVYSAATAAVLWARATGRLVPVTDVPWPVLAGAAAGVIGYAGYVVWMLITSGSKRKLT